MKALMFTAREKAMKALKWKSIHDCWRWHGSLKDWSLDC
jgi:hypothetical protein